MKSLSQISPNEKDSTPNLHNIKSVSATTRLASDNPTMDDDYLFAASASDCTGLAPTVAHNEYEAESYDEIAHYLPPVPPSTIPGMSQQEAFLTDGVAAISPAEGIHAEVNTLDKNTASKAGLEGNHLL